MTSAAITVLVSEIVTIEHDYDTARENEETAGQKSIVARQALDARILERQIIGERLEATKTALSIIRSRDQASEDTVGRLLDNERAARR